MIELSRLLETRGLSTFLDRKDLSPGLPWPAALEQGLAEAEAVAVFLGKGGLGPWQKREMWFALDRQARAEKAGERFPVIPVLLPGADPTAGFLFLNTWIDLRHDPMGSEGLERLASAVEAEASESSLEALPSFCPYRGLEPFGEEESAFFCGREAFSERLLEAVLKDPFVAVVGSSGSGKSSVVHAGLLPLLRRQRPPAPAWDAVTFTPGERPYHRLAAALMPLLEPVMTERRQLEEIEEWGKTLAADKVPLEEVLRRVLDKSKGTGRLLLVADQFEELFTLTPEPARKPFFETLLAVTGKLPVTLVLTLRADFYDRALTLSRDLSDRLEKGQVNLGPMRREELALAITEPARRVRLDFEPGLVERILDDVGGEPGNLPLLEFALTELWNRRSGRLLTHAGYTESGEVVGAIAHRAESEFERLNSEQRKVAQRIFTSLVRVSRVEEGSRDTRKRAPLEDFDEAEKAVVGRLAGPDARLLVTGRNEKGESVVEVTHEALIQHWGRLRRWLDEDREFLLWRERLRVYLAEYARNGDLLSGASLAEADRWLRGWRESMNAEEIAFIEDSLAAWNMMLREQRRRTQAGIGVTLLIGILGAFAVWFGLQMARQATEARVSSILATQDAIQDPAILALLALEIDKVEAPQAKRSLEAVRFARRAAASVFPVAVFRWTEGLVHRAVFSRDGSRVAISHLGIVRIWNADGSSIDRCGEGLLPDAAFSPDGSLVITVCDEQSQVWNTDGSGNPFIFQQNRFSVVKAAFSPDGSRIFSATEDGTAWIQNVDRSGRPVSLGTHQGAVAEIAFNSDGTRVVTTSDDFTLNADGSREISLLKDGAVWIWNVDDPGNRVRVGGGEEKACNAIFSPDGSKILTSSCYGTVQIWNVDSPGKPVAREEYQDEVLDAAFSHDGTHVLTFSRDGTAWSWRADGSGKPAIILSRQEEVIDAEFSPDGSRVLTTFKDGTAKIWSADGSGRLGVTLSGHQGAVLSGVFSPDGSRVLTVSSDSSARIWNVKDLIEPVVLQGPTDQVLNVAFSPEGSRILAGSFDGTAWIWKVDDSGETSVLDGHEGEVLSGEFSRDGTRILTTCSEGPPRVWSAGHSSEAIIIGKSQGTVQSADFSPDGLHVLTTSFGSPARIWKADRSGEVVEIGEPRDQVSKAVFSADGSRVLTISPAGVVQIWGSRGAGKYVALQKFGDGASLANFSRDGSRIFTAASFGLARIRNADGSGQPLVLRGDQGGEILQAAFSPDGSRVLTESNDGTVQVLYSDGPRSRTFIQGQKELSRSISPRRGFFETPFRGFSSEQLAIQMGATFSPDGSSIVAPGKNSTAQIWSVEGFGEPVVLAGHQGKVWGAAFSPDGSRVATASADGTVRVWRVTWDSLIDHLRKSINLCLTPEQRTQYLGEAPDDAREAFESCEQERKRRRPAA